MKISPAVEKLLNGQLNLELESQQAYLALAGWFETTPYKGFAKWMRKQSDEEHGHAMRFFDYINDRGGTVLIGSLAAPKSKFASPLAAFRASLAHEEKVTASIHEIYAAAEKGRDFATTEFLNWFLKEQVEEEKSVQEVIDQLELAEKDVDALLRLDIAAAHRGEEK